MYRARGRELLGVFKHYISHQTYWTRGRELLGVFKHYVSHQMYWARGKELLGMFKLYIHSQSSSFLCTIIQQPSVQKYTYSDSSVLNLYCLASKTRLWQYSDDLNTFNTENITLRNLRNYDEPSNTCIRGIQVITKLI